LGPVRTYDRSVTRRGVDAGDLLVVEIVDGVEVTPTSRRSAGPDRASGRGFGAGWACAGVLLAAVVTMLVGFAVNRPASLPAAAGPTSPNTSAPAVPWVLGGVYATGRRCAVRYKSELQLGVEVVNLGREPVGLLRMALAHQHTAIHATVTGLGTCAQWGPTEALAGAALLPGRTAWLSALFDVTAACMHAEPLRLRLTYTAGGRHTSTYLTGFPDLADAPYPNCTDR
jgi:hypothetical protein